MRYLRCYVTKKNTLSEITVLPILESLSFVQTHGASVARFGDGEVDIMMGHSIPYQDYDEILAGRLREILSRQSDEKLMVCLPDVFNNLERYNTNARAFWADHFSKYGDFYLKACQSSWYGSTFISRPYIDLVDKSPAQSSFDALKELWRNRDIVIVEGETSCSGVGNDLFAAAKSISRIICPSRNAFAQYDLILEEVKRVPKESLVLLMLGPTAKVLAYDLMLQGYQAIDLGHIDSEYEWFQMKATHKVKLNHKHTAEFNYDEAIVFEKDSLYESQILAKITSSIERKENLMSSESVISIIVPVYNTSAYLRRCMKSLLNQTYQNFEIILINDGSTDGSGLLCEEYAESDQRIRLIHQENAGPSAARNRGIELASGDYITFVDSDDFVEPNYLERLYQTAKTNDTDIAICNFNSFNEERQSFLFSITSEMFFEKVYTVQEWLDQENVPKNNLFLAFTLTTFKLFKAELFEGLVFPVGRLREDDATVYKLYLKANKIAFINQGLYYYSQHATSLSHNSMQTDIEGMIRNAEERIVLLTAMGYDATQHLVSYQKRLEKCQRDAMASGQITLYQDISTKLDLIRHFKKNGGEDA